MSAGYASDGAANIIQLKVTTLGGDAFSVQLPSDASGNDLWEELAKKYAPYGSQKFQLLCIGQTPVSLDESLWSQATKRGKLEKYVYPFNEFQFKQRI